MRDYICEIKLLVTLYQSLGYWCKLLLFKFCFVIERIICFKELYHHNYRIILIMIRQMYRFVKTFTNNVHLWTMYPVNISITVRTNILCCIASRNIYSAIDYICEYIYARLNCELLYIGLNVIDVNWYYLNIVL
jgi:hypothetical protein